MVLQVTIYRAADGLPLTGSTDIDRTPEVRHCQRYLKLISRRLNTLPDKCVLQLEGFHIYFVSASTLSFLVLCEDTYPMVLSFCFLDEIQKEFLLTYDHDRVVSTKRPYGLIAFEIYLQKTKQKYNNTRSLNTRRNLSDMSTELKLRAPFIIQEGDLGLRDNSIVKPFKDTYRPTVIPGRRLIPISWIGMIAIFLNLFCMAVNFTRGMTIIGHGHFDDMDAGAYQHGGAFIASGLAAVYQVYLIFYFCRWRKLKTFFSFCMLCGCVFYLQQFRNDKQIAFHVTVALFSSIVIHCRKLTEKLPGYSV